MKRPSRLAGIALAALILAGCGAPADKPEIKQCADAGGIALRAWWDATVLAECVFKPAAR